ncbi:hypothetical protein EZS27_016702 [termite gut metagenome]|uniref:Uncharacterized protein n=1 Tax=termite gut metagenome TaxID=433724 RepID=A0A5J4RN13_9ZZZZ
MEKITIQHFVNKELNPRVENGKQKYPVYVQVITLRKNLRFKSNNNFFEYLSEDELKNELAQNILKEENKVIEYIVRDLIKKEKKNLVTSKNLSLFSQNLNDTIDNNFPKFLLQEHEETGKYVPDLLLSANYEDVKEIVNFLGNDSPIRAISENLYYCLDALQAIYKETNKGLFYVYDLFYGNKKETLEKLISCEIDFDHNETDKRISILQKLVAL